VMPEVFLPSETEKHPRKGSLTKGKFRSSDDEEKGKRETLEPGPFLRRGGGWELVVGHQKSASSSSSENRAERLLVSIGRIREGQDGLL